MSAGDGEDAVNRLCELNVIEQVVNVCRTSVVQEAWERGQALEVHGWVYGLKDGLLKDLGLSVGGAEGLERAYSEAVGRLRALT
jgi:carbonic anhydrase